MHIPGIAEPVDYRRGKAVAAAPCNVHHGHDIAFAVRQHAVVVVQLVTLEKQSLTHIWVAHVLARPCARVDTRFHVKVIFSAEPHAIGIFKVAFPIFGKRRKNHEL